MEKQDMEKIIGMLAIIEARMDASHKEMLPKMDADGQDGRPVNGHE
jgi:hypothetical protein